MLGAGVDGVCCSRAGSRLVDKPRAGLSVIPSRALRRGKGGMVRCDGFVWTRSITGDNHAELARGS